MKRAAEIVATVFVQNTALVTIGGGVMNTRATLDYQISQGELKQVRVQIPAGQRLLRVEGDAIRSWEIKDDTLVVDLLKGVSPAWKLTVETEKVLDKLPATAQVELPHALDVKRETGLVALRASEELSLTVENAQELQRVDAEEFYRAAPDKKDGILSAFRFLKTDFGLSVARGDGAAADRGRGAQQRADRRGIGAVGRADGLHHQAGRRVRAAAGAAGGLPARKRHGGQGVPVGRAQRGRRARSSRSPSRSAPSAPTCSTWSLAQNYAQPPQTLAIAGVHPLGTQKLSGYITVATDLGVAAKTGSFEGLTEIPFASVPGERAGSGGSALAYKFIATTPAAAPPWKLSVTTEAVEPWLRAEIMNTITLTETLVSGRTLVKIRHRQCAR